MNEAELQELEVALSARRAKEQPGFIRMEDGGVLVMLDEKHCVVSPEKWCETIASVRPLGVTGEGVAAARAFHGIS